MEFEHWAVFYIRLPFRIIWVGLQRCQRRMSCHAGTDSTAFSISSPPNVEDEEGEAVREDVEEALVSMAEPAGHPHAA